MEQLLFEEIGRQGLAFMLMATGIIYLAYELKETRQKLAVSESEHKAMLMKLIELDRYNSQSSQELSKAINDLVVNVAVNQVKDSLKEKHHD